MKLEQVLMNRGGGKCELCQSDAHLSIYEVPPPGNKNENNCLMLCPVCKAQVEKKAEPDLKHWQCLSTSMWSEVPVIKVVCWRMLNRLSMYSWAADNLEMLYLEEEDLEWAKSTGDHLQDSGSIFHKDAFGNVLQTGDTVLLTQSLNVKGATVNAKVGTVVKNIHLVAENPEQIEGRIEGQLIVILTKYVKKQH